MLLVFYGLTLDVGNQVRTHLRERGFDVIKKEVFEEKDTPVKSHFEVREVSDERLKKECDFLYETNYGYAGFRTKDIFPAIYGEKNAMIAMTSPNISFLKHVKTAYGDFVTVIGTYITPEAQVELIEKDPSIGKEEREKRLDMGKVVHRVLNTNRELFDNILIYGGENSCFNLEALNTQLDVFKTRALEKQHKFLDSKYIEAPYQGSENYVFLSYSHADKEIAYDFISFLQFNGIRVWYDSGIPYGDNWMNFIAQKIDKAAATVLLSTPRAAAPKTVAGSDIKLSHIEAELSRTLFSNKRLIKINVEPATYSSGTEMYMHSINQLNNLSDISYAEKKTLISTLKSLM